MKKNIFLLLLTIFTTSVFSQNGVLDNTTINKNNKFGHVDVNAILLQMPEFIQAENELKKFGENLDNRLREMMNEGQKKLQDLQANEANYTELIKQDKIAEIQNIEARIQTFQQDATRQVQEKKVQLIQPINDKLVKAIQDVAKEGNYTYIFYSDALIYGEESNDIGSLVKKKLGL